MQKIINMYHPYHKDKKEGQRAAFIAAHDKYADAIYRYCFFRVSSQNIAEEITQETFIRLWKYMTKGKKIENIQAFLYHISRNLIIDSYRKKAIRNREEESLDVLLAKNGSAAEPSYDGRLSLEQNITLRETIKIMKYLPRNYREVLNMHCIKGLGPKEIAKILGTNPNNISARIYKARKKMRAYSNISPKQIRILYKKNNKIVNSAMESAPAGLKV